MALIQNRKPDSKTRQDFKLPAAETDIRGDFNLETQKGSLLKYNEDIRTAKSITFRDNGRLQIPVFASDTAVCVIGEIALIGGTMKFCSAANTWSAI